MELLMEQLLHYIWKYRLYNNKLVTNEGHPIEIIDTGTPNTNEGPDFFNAKIRIADKIWVGNIEIHCSSDEWYKHNHHTNPTYNSVILHVVENLNKEVFDAGNRAVAQCKITYPATLRDNIDFLIHSDTSIPCRNHLASIPSIHIGGWINTLLIERLERKAHDIEKHFKRTNGSWEEIFYILLCRNFGFGLNADIFERLALSIPLSYIRKHADNLQQIEALLFGQASFLEDDSDDNYYNELKKEYGFLKGKFNLTPLKPSFFCRLRIRPSGSPYIRIAQLAKLLHTRKNLFSKIRECCDIGQLRLLFHENASEYWQTHYAFGEESPKKSKYLGNSSLDVIIINTVSPILFAFGKKTGNEELCELSLYFLENIKTESNYIIRDFSSAGLKARNAYESQALIQLKKEYCDRRKCLFCRIGFKILSEKQ